MQITKLTIAACLVAAATFVSFTPLHAQDDAPAALGTINLDFKGGSVADYIAALRKQATGANIVVTSDLSDVPMPAVQLQRVDPWAAVQILQELPQQHPGRRVKMGVGRIGTAPGSAPVYTIAAEIESYIGPQNQGTMVFEIGDLLRGDLKADAVLTAIEAALAMIKDETEAAQIRFHPDTGLLITRGTPEQVNTIEQVIERLQRRVDRERIRQEQANMLKQEASQAGTLREQLANTARELESTVLEMTRLRTRAELLEREVQIAKEEVRERDLRVQSVLAELAEARHTASKDDAPPAATGQP